MISLLTWALRSRRAAAEADACRYSLDQGRDLIPLRSGGKVSSSSNSAQISSSVAISTSPLPGLASTTEGSARAGPRGRIWPNPTTLRSPKGPPPPSPPPPSRKATRKFPGSRLSGFISCPARVAAMGRMSLTSPCR